MSGVMLTITLSEGGTAYRIEDELEEVKTGKLQPDQLRQDTIAIFSEWLRRGNAISRREELKVLGHHLYDTIFQGEVREFFASTLKRVPPNERLRVRLNFDKTAGELAAMPWEYLWYPQRPMWFSTAVNLVLSRYLPLAEGAPQKTLDPGESPLRILIMVSEPTDLKPVLAAPVIEAIEKLKERYDVDVQQHVGPTRDNFGKALREHDPHVLHFLGHGRFQRAENPPRAEIAFLESPEKPTAVWVRDEEFAETFTQAKVRPRLVFLHLCESAAVDFNASFAGLAPQLLRQAAIPAVVAMQYPIENRFAIQFSRAFYEQIAEYAHVDDAVQVARYKLTLASPQAYDSRVFGTPVLYMYSRDAILRPAAKQPGGSPVHAAASAPSTATTVAEAPPAKPPVRGNTPTPGQRIPVQTAPEASRSSAVPRENPTILVDRTVVDPSVRKILQDARRTTRARIDAMIVAEEKDQCSRRLSNILDEISKNPNEYREILNRNWDNTEGSLRDIVELIIDSIEEPMEELKQLRAAGSNA